MLIKVFQIVPINAYSYPMKTGLMKHSCGAWKVTELKHRKLVNCLLVPVFATTHRLNQLTLIAWVKVFHIYITKEFCIFSLLRGHFSEPCKSQNKSLYKMHRPLLAAYGAPT